MWGALAAIGEGLRATSAPADKNGVIPEPMEEAFSDTG